jgi:Protein of unknown function (DUF3551)
MRKILFLLSAAAALVTVGAPASSAAEFQYCLQSADAGYPGDCLYRNFAECQASASGRNASCGINPRYAYSQQRGVYRR